MLAVLLSFAAGALATLSPCVLPVLPIVVGSAFQKHRHGPLVLSVGLVSSFAALGLLTGLGVELLVTHRDTLRRASGLAMLLTGLVLLIPALQVRVAGLLSRLTSSTQTSTAQPPAQAALLSLFLIGAGLGVVWAPCSGPMLAGALALAAASGTRWSALLQLTAFGVGTATPLLASAYLARSVFRRYAERAMSTGRAGSRLFAASLVLMGALIVSGADKSLESRVLDLLPEPMMDLVLAL
jgi:cytochrome c-type biogenesis protein